MHKINAEGGLAMVYTASKFCLTANQDRDYTQSVYKDYGGVGITTLSPIKKSNKATDKHRLNTEKDDFKT